MSFGINLFHTKAKSAVFFTVHEKINKRAFSFGELKQWANYFILSQQ